MRGRRILIDLCLGAILIAVIIPIPYWIVPSCNLPEGVLAYSQPHCFFGHLFSGFKGRLLAQLFIYAAMTLSFMRGHVRIALIFLLVSFAVFLTAVLSSSVVPCGSPDPGCFGDNSCIPCRD